MSTCRKVNRTKRTHPTHAQSVVELDWGGGPTPSRRNLSHIHVRYFYTVGKRWRRQGGTEEKRLTPYCFAVINQFQCRTNHHRLQNEMAVKRFHFHPSPHTHTNLRPSFGTGGRRSAVRGNFCGCHRTERPSLKWSKIGYPGAPGVRMRHRASTDSKQSGSLFIYSYILSEKW